jgi:methyl-accepting chemotaxis protein
MSVFVLGPLRKEMKERVDQLLAAQKEATAAVRELTAAIRELNDRSDVKGLTKLSTAWSEAAERTQQASSGLEDTLTKISDALK